LPKCTPALFFVASCAFASHCHRVCAHVEISHRQIAQFLGANARVDERQYDCPVSIRGGSMRSNRIAGAPVVRDITRLEQRRDFIAREFEDHRWFIRRWLDRAQQIALDDLFVLGPRPQ
jgi:hypothetical protein